MLYCTIPYHTLPYHTILYCTVPYILDYQKLYSNWLHPVLHPMTDVYDGVIVPVIFEFTDYYCTIDRNRNQRFHLEGNFLPKGNLRNLEGKRFWKEIERKFDHWRGYRRNFKIR